MSAASARAGACACPRRCCLGLTTAAALFLAHRAPPPAASPEQEVANLTQNYAGLMAAQRRFQESKKSLKTLTPEAMDKPVLVPLTQSLYVSGTISDTTKVMVDIGTGYYVEKPVAKAKDFMDRKAKMLEQNTNSLSDLIQTKQKNLQSVMQVMQMRMKMAEQQQQQGGGKTTSTVMRGAMAMRK